MNLLQEAAIRCPYCGETIPILVDTSLEHQDYIEDCAVCCRPIQLRLSAAPGELLRISARREDEA